MIKLKTNLQPAALAHVTVTDGYCKNALEKETAYLLSLQEGRLLAGFCENAGLKTPFVRYGGWESGLIGGHTLGHYLTAVAQGAVNPAVPASEREKLYNKMKNIVDSYGGLLRSRAASRRSSTMWSGARRTSTRRRGCRGTRCTKFWRGSWRRISSRDMRPP